jgi:SAM-dependent MidA family methyltransferase
VPEPASTLAERLGDRIRSAGPIGLAEYMAAALGDPDFGYYATAEPFGAAGDFITAPEISQMFGELVGLWCAVVWDQMGAPDPVHLVELGPGRGTLMADALRALKGAPRFRAALRVSLIETSPALRRQQAAALSAAAPRWHDDFAAVPDGPAIIVANEFFDALPIRQLQRGPRFWHERLVDLDPAGGCFRVVPAAEPSPLAALLGPAFDRAPVGSVAELCPPALALARAIGERIAASGGAALVIDYGYAASAPGDTLQAVRGHRRHDPLHAPGTADLTAHVDFTRLIQAARDGGAAVHGPVGQGALLRRLGIAARAERLCACAAPEQAAQIQSGLRRLIDPGEMGTLFKAVAFAHPRQGAPSGFEA